MTANNRFFDDLSKLMTNAMGVAQGAKDEAQTAFNGWIDRWLAERDFVTREEFEAVPRATRVGRRRWTTCKQPWSSKPPPKGAPAWCAKRFWS